MTVSNMKLVKIASIGGIITCTTGLLMQWKLKDRIRHTDFYQEAFKILRSHNGALTLLGEPVKEGNFSFTNKDNYCNDSRAHFEVNVKGPKQKGVLYFWANRSDEKWNVNRVELGLNNEPDRRLLLRNISDDL